MNAKEKADYLRNEIRFLANTNETLRARLAEVEEERDEVRARLAEVEAAHQYCGVDYATIRRLVVWAVRIIRGDRDPDGLRSRQQESDEWLADADACLGQDKPASATPEGE